MSMGIRISDQLMKEARIISTVEHRSISSPNCNVDMREQAMPVTYNFKWKWDALCRHWLIKGKTIEKK